MANNSRKKLDEYHTKVLRELGALPFNKHCFDCNQRGPTYVNVTIGSFVCTKCSGILRGLTPPHRVKSISMTTFTPEEVEMLKSRGNDYCRKVWLAHCDTNVQHTSEQQIKDFMADKYEKKRYYKDPSTIPNLKSPPVQVQSQPLPSVQQTSTHRPVPLRTTQITLTNGSSAVPPPSSNSQNTNTSISSNTITNSLFNVDFNSAPKDPFSNSSSIPSRSFSSIPRSSTISQISNHQTPPVQQQQPSFANFDNAVFSSVQDMASLNDSLKKPPMAMSSPLEIQKEDKYAALKDLDSIMKQQNQLSTTPTKNTLDNQSLTTDNVSTNGWNGVFGSPNTAHGFFPSASSTTGSSSSFSSPNLNGSTTFSTPSNNAFTLFNNSSPRSTDSPLSNGIEPTIANPFNSVNPFKIKSSPDAWPSQTVSNGLVTNGFPMSQSQSMDFPQWSAVNHHIVNPFKMNAAPPQTTAPHHSSNPFL